jgi:hypothetical protein
METEQIVDSQVTDTQEPTQEAPEAGQETQAEQTQQPAGMTPRQQRRNVFNENLALKKENERLMREMAERMGDSMASRVGQEVGRAVERFAPPRPAPQDLAFEEYRDAARSLNPEDPKSLRRFADAQTKLVNAGLNVEDLVRAEIQKAMPVQRPPEIQRLIMEFPWVEEGDNSDGVAYHFKRLIRDRDRNSAAVRIATLREAALRVAQDNGIPVGDSRDTSAGSRFSSPGGRNGASSAAPGTIDHETAQKIDEAAAAMYPNIAPEKRRAHWLKMNGKQSGLL